MELDSSNQVSSDFLQNQNFDIIIGASGYESRCTYLSNKIDVTKIPIRIVLAFKEKSDTLYRKHNDELFANWEFKFYKVSTYDISPLNEILNKTCLSQSKDSLNILIDYSGMPKIWYRGIIDYFLELEEQLVNAKLWFSYSPSIYSKFKSGNQNCFRQEVPLYKADKPIALILGLGYEKGKADELLQRLKAEVTYIFYADPAVDERFVNDVRSNNEELFQQIDESKHIKYSINDLNSINNSLTKVCLKFRVENQLILAPLGPKPFSLLCYTIAARYPDIKIWEVRTFGELIPYDRKAQGELLVYQMEFTSEEVDYCD